MELTWLLIRIQQFFVRFIKGADFIGNFSRRLFTFTRFYFLMLARHSRKLSLYFFFNLWWCLLSFSNSSYFKSNASSLFSYFAMQCLLGNFTNHVTRWSNQDADTNSKSRVISLCGARSISNGRWRCLRGLHLVSFCLVCLKIIVYEPVAGC